MTFKDMHEQRAKELQQYLVSYNERLHAIREKMALETADFKMLRDELMLASDAAIDLAKMAMNVNAHLSRQFYGLALEMTTLALGSIRDQHAPRLEEFQIPAGTSADDSLLTR